MQARRGELMDALDGDGLVGIGRQLLDAAAGGLRELGVDRVWLVTTNENLEALALYQRAGYRLTALH